MEADQEEITEVEEEEEEEEDRESIAEEEGMDQDNRPHIFSLNLMISHH